MCKDILPLVETPLNKFANASVFMYVLNHIHSYACIFLASLWESSSLQSDTYTEIQKNNVWFEFLSKNLVYNVATCLNNKHANTNAKVHHLKA